jgi:D-cysteine desulfhydrase
MFGGSSMVTVVTAIGYVVAMRSYDLLAERFPDMRGLPYVDLGVRATPVEGIRLGGLDFQVKREGRCCERYGGNKARCLEFLLARPADRLLTFSTLSANHAYAVAVHGNSLGLKTDAILVRKGQRGEMLKALHGVAAGVAEVDGVAGAMLAAASLWRRGTRIIPPGGVSARGALGYLCAALEFETIPERIYVPLGSGTTVSGLLAGLTLRGARTEIVGVRVADRIAGVRALLWHRARGALRILRRHGAKLPRQRSEVRLRVVAAEGDYGEETAAAREAVDAAAGAGLTLETTYTGKALAVLLREQASGALFLDTYGGLPPAG